MSDCLFCRMIEGDIPCDKVYEDDYVLAFRDIDPKAPAHILLIPKKHIENIAMAESEDYATHIFKAVRIICEQEKLCKEGFRVVVNTGKYGGQSVDHLHLHIMGGRQMAWPPG